MKPLLLSTLLLGATFGAVCQAAPTKKAVKKTKKSVAKAPKVITTASGLKIQDWRVGKGPIARAGQNVTVNYRGTLSNGTLFDQSYGKAPFSFELGAGGVIRGWDEGVAGMRVGGKRKLIIPSKLGYGATGTPGGPIPPNANLVFVVELLKAG